MELERSSGKVFAGEDDEEEEDDDLSQVPWDLEEKVKNEKNLTDDDEKDTAVKQRHIESNKQKSNCNFGVTKSPQTSETFDDEIANGAQQRRQDRNRLHSAKESSTTKKDECPIMGMAEALLSRIQVPLQTTLDKLTEFSGSQEHLLEILDTQRLMYDTPELEKIYAVMDQVPAYQAKAQRMNQTMSLLTVRLERLKKQTIELQENMQQRALAREERQDAVLQWNKLYAAKVPEVVESSDGDDNHDEETE